MTQQRSGRRFRLLRGGLHIALVLWCVTVALDFGFEASPLNPVCRPLIEALVLAGFVAMRLARRRRRPASVRGRLAELMEPAAAAVAVAWGLAARNSWQIVLLTLSLYVVLLTLGRMVRYRVFRLARLCCRPHPQHRLVGSMVICYIGFTIAGGALLALPRSNSVEIRSQTGYYALDRILNGAFTAAAATSLTAFSAYHLGQDYTRFGQVVIGILMQLGGVLAMIFGTLLTWILFPGVLSTGRPTRPQQVLRVMKWVCVTILLSEAAVTVGLIGLSPTDQSAGDRGFWSVFHAVSAFCNAGLTLTEDSLIAYQDRWQIYAFIVTAVIAGGLGFPVLAELVAAARRKPAALSRHTRWVLVWSAGLIVVPSAILAIRTPPPSTAVAGRVPLGTRLRVAVFDAVSCRSAGFEVSGATAQPLPPGWPVRLALMGIGGAPASTAGGVKVTAVALVAAAVLGRIRAGRQRPPGRRGDAIVFRWATQVLAGMIILTLLVCGGLYLTEAAPLAVVLFDAVSACANCGVSAGLVGHLTVPGRLLVMVAMIAGRCLPWVLIVRAGRETRTLTPQAIGIG